MFCPYARRGDLSNWERSPPTPIECRSHPCICPCSRFVPHEQALVFPPGIMTGRCLCMGCGHHQCHVRIHPQSSYCWVCMAHYDDWYDEWEKKDEDGQDGNDKPPDAKTKKKARRVVIKTIKKSHKSIGTSTEEGRAVSSSCSAKRHKLFSCGSCS